MVSAPFDRPPVRRLRCAHTAELYGDKHTAAHLYFVTVGAGGPRRLEQPNPNMELLRQTTIGRAWV